MNTKEIIKAGFIPRNSNSHKNNYGNLVIIGGSKKYPGAPLIASYGASVSGVGYTALVVTDDVYPSVVNRIPEVIYECLGDSFASEDVYKNLLTYSSIVFGNGIEVDEDNCNLLRRLLQNYKSKLVIDATGLSILKIIGLDTLCDSKADIVLTPHLGEFGQLFNLDIKGKVAADYIDFLKQATSKYNCTIDLKSAGSVIVKKERVFEIPNLVPGLAKAGTGDFLAGLIGGLLAYHPLDAVNVTTFAHALLVEAGELLSQTVSPHAFRATMLVEPISKILKEEE